jgi:hypothetical protein
MPHGRALVRRALGARRPIALERRPRASPTTHAALPSIRRALARDRARFRAHSRPAGAEVNGRRRDAAAGGQSPEGLTSMKPIKDLTNMIRTPIQAVFVVGICYLINQFTSPTQMWWHWVALGMGIATAVALAKGLRTLAVLGLAWWVGLKLYRRFGPQMRAAFDAWVNRTQPGFADVLRAWREPHGVVDGAVGGVPPVRH